MTWDACFAAAVAEPILTNQACNNLEISSIFMLFACFFGAQPSNQPSTLAMLEATTFSSCMPFLATQFSFFERFRCVCPRLTSTKGIPDHLQLRSLFSVCLGPWIQIQNFAPQHRATAPTNKTPCKIHMAIISTFFCESFKVGIQKATHIHASTASKARARWATIHFHLSQFFSMGSKMPCRPLPLQHPIYSPARARWPLNPQSFESVFN